MHRIVAAIVIHHSLHYSCAHMQLAHHVRISLQEVARLEADHATQVARERALADEAMRVRREKLAADTAAARAAKAEEAAGLDAETRDRLMAEFEVGVRVRARWWAMVMLLWWVVVAVVAAQ